MLTRLFQRKPMVVFIFLLSISVVYSCGDTPTDPDPETPTFSITSISFTGDSTGSSNSRFGVRASSRRAANTDSKDDPYTEVTLAWSAIDIDSVLNYSVCRSEEPGIPSGSTSYTTAGITTDTSCVDEDSLAWGYTYYYAVKATGSDSSEYWSNEVSIVMPNSQFPTPSVLTAVDLPVGHCQLSWTACPDSDFHSYTLIINDYPQLFNAETLCIVNDVDETDFLDSLPPLYTQRYYQVLTTDDQGLTVGSNFLEYINAYGTPWLLNYYVWDSDPMCYPSGNILSSSDESSIYFTHITEYPTYTIGFLKRVDTENGSTTSYCTGSGVLPVSLLLRSQIMC